MYLPARIISLHRSAPTTILVKWCPKVDGCSTLRAVLASIYFIENVLDTPVKIGRVSTIVSSTSTSMAKLVDQKCAWRDNHEPVNFLLCFDECLLRRQAFYMVRVDQRHQGS